MHGDSTHTYAFNGDGALARQSTVGGPLHGVSLEQSFDATGRREHLTAHLPHGQRLDQHYGFDQRGRLQTVRQGNREARYTFDEVTGALTHTRFLTGGQPIAETVREFDALNRLEQIETRSLKEGGDFHQSFAYRHNDANQRTRVESADGSYWQYEYDHLGQLVSARRHWQNGEPVAGQQFEYTFDQIGNRETSRYGGDSTTQLART